MSANPSNTIRIPLLRRPLVVLGLAALFAPLAYGVAAASPSPPPAPTSSQRAQALVSPSVVYVGVHWKAWVQMPRDIPVDGVLHTPGWAGPYTVNTACSGFVADPSGYVVTAGHCVDNVSMDSGGKAAIVDAAVAKIGQIFAGVMTKHQLGIVHDAIETYGRVESRASGSPPQRTITVYPTGLTNARGLIAGVEEFKPLSEGDVALLKVSSSTPLPSVGVAAEDPPIGTSILLAGYPGSVTGMVDPGQQPSFKDGETSSQQTINGVPFTEVSAAASAGMSGGPAVDMNGKVVGTVSFKPGGETQEFNFITATSTVRSLLSRNGVDGQPGPADTAYRLGLEAFWAGRYHDAAAEFEKVLAVQPDHQSTLVYKRLSIENYPNDVSNGGGNTLVVILAIGAGVLLAGAIAFVLIRRRRGAAPAAGPAAAPVPTPPVMPTVPPPSEMPTVPAPRAAAAPSVAAPTPKAPVAKAGPAPAEPTAAGGFCPNCGEPHEVGAHFCEACGEHLKEVAGAHGGRWNGKK